MNEQLIKFIELCLVDGVISDKEREVIFRKSKELGVPDDECEILIDSLVSKHSERGNPINKKDKSELIKENYFDFNLTIKWFKKWLEIDTQIDFLKKKSQNIFWNSIPDFKIEEQRPFNNYNENSQRFISKENLLKLMDLKDINGQQGSPGFLWKKEVPHIESKKGSIENKFKNILSEKLKNEEFICYLSYSEIGDKTFGYNPVHWYNNSIEEMIQYYHNPSQNFGKKGWYNYFVNPQVFVMRPRKCVLITNKTITEFQENSSDINSYKFDKCGSDILSTKVGGFNPIYKPIMFYLFQSKDLNIDNLIPPIIEFDSFDFVTTIEKIGLDTRTERIIEVNRKLKQYVDSIYNDELNKIKDKKLFFFQVSSEKTVIDTVVEKIKINPIIEIIVPLSLEVFTNYINLLNYRDSLLNKYIKGDLVQLEIELKNFEDSFMGMSNFQKTSINKLNEINDNLVQINDTLMETKLSIEERLNTLSDELGLLGVKISDLQTVNEKISGQLSNLNFISTISLYQQYKINQNTKGLRE